MNFLVLPCLSTPCLSGAASLTRVPRGLVVGLAVLLSMQMVMPAWAQDTAGDLDSVGTVPSMQAAEPSTEPASDPSPESSGSELTPAAAPPFTMEAVPFTPDTALDDLGGLDADANDTVHLIFSEVGAGLKSVELANFSEDLAETEPVSLQKEWSNANGTARAAPFGALFLQISEASSAAAGVANKSATLDLTGGTAPVWTQTAPGEFVAHVLRDGERVVRLQRRYVLPPGRSDFELIQTITNLSQTPLWVRYAQYGPIDMEPGSSLYGGEKRRLRFGWLESPQTQARSMRVYPDGRLEPRTDGDIIGKRTNGFYESVRQVWPDERRLDKRLVWFAFTDRYFGVGVTRRFPNDALTVPEDLLIAPVIESIDRVVLEPYSGDPFIARLNAPRVQLGPGESFDASLLVYVGPMDTEVINADPRLEAAGMSAMVVYKMVGGFCGICTFEPLTDLILLILNALHAVTFDWSLAIILLVVCVRTVLHPITRFSQSRMLVFSTQMQALGPKMQKIQEKHKNDPTKLNEARMELWREEGINPAGMLGCLPMFLQSPVWIALYATLFFDIALRHQPAFFGVFQAMGGWTFMNDLAEPDHAIPLPAAVHFTMPLMGEITAINVLPLLLGVVFYIHQKFMTPPPTATMTPEQETQQKMMKIMSVVMFPVFMYNAPSGLTLYFITNSSLGILENKWVRASLKKKGLLDIDNIKAMKAEKQAARAKRRPAKAGAAGSSGASGKSGGGFMDRLRAAAEEAQRQREANESGRKTVKNTKNPYESQREREEADRRSQARYKKRK